MKMVRILVYEGDPEWIKMCVERRNIKETVCISNNKIIEAHIGFDGGFFESFYESKGGETERKTWTEDSQDYTP